MAKKKKAADEIEELDRIYNSLAGPAKKAKKGSVLTVLAVLLLFVAGGFMAFLFFGDALIPEEPQRLESFRAAGVDLTGMTLEEATQALQQATGDTYSQMDMVILVEDQEYRLSPADSKVQLDAQPFLQAAFADPAVDPLDYLNLDVAALDVFLARLDEIYNAPAGKTTCQYDEAAKQLTLTLGTPQTGLDISALRERILDAYRANLFQLRQDCTRQQPENVDLDALFAQYHIPAVDAVMDMSTFEVSPHAVGQTFDLEAAKAAYSALSYGETMIIPLLEVPPEATQEALAAILYRDVLAEYETRHTWDDYRTENLRLACQAINGMILMPGQQFQYNDALGERTADKGYKPAGSYVNGETVATYGGGICQVSSTLYYCTLIADLQIDKRFPHSYVSSYIPLGMDATVSWGGPDFWFTNNSRYPVRIEAWVADQHVHVKLIGTDEKDYYVKMEYETLRSIGYDIVYKEMPPDNEKGFVDGDVITTPYTGYQVKTYKLRYSKETDELLSREFEADSTYKKRDKVICKIVDPNAPTESVTDPEAPPAENQDLPAVG